MWFVAYKNNNNKSKSFQCPCEVHHRIPTITFDSLNPPCFFRLTEEFNFVMFIKICNLWHTKGKTQQDLYSLLLIYLNTFHVPPLSQALKINFCSWETTCPRVSPSGRCSVSRGSRRSRQKSPLSGIGAHKGSPPPEFWVTINSLLVFISSRKGSPGS